MFTKWLPTLVLGVSAGMMGCGSSTPDPSNTGGTGTGGAKPSTGGGGGTSIAGSSSVAGSSTGGAPGTAGGSSAGTTSGGTSSGGTAAGGTASAGMSSGGKASGGTSTGGTSAGGGSAGGGTSTGGGGGGGGTGGKLAPAPSKGCGVMDGAKTLTMGGMSVAKGLPTSTILKITSGGASREYIIDIPANYDPTHPYRLIFSWHQLGGSDVANAIGQYPAFMGPNFDAKNYAFFGLQREATAANEPAIFVAPNGGNPTWTYEKDVVLFDDLLALVDSKLCIDDNRVFATGFSYGAMMSYALSIGRASKLRAVVTMAAANFNFTQPTNAHTPLAYLGFTGMSDGRCPWVSNDSKKEGGKYCVLQHAEDNGCKSATIPTTTANSKKYLCYDFEGCKAGYPVRACTFDGAHTPSTIDDGTSNGDDGLKSFIPKESWKFISQF